MFLARTKLKIIFIIGMLFLPILIFANTPKVEKLDVLNIANHTRLVFSLSGPFTYHVASKDHSTLLSVDFNGARLATSLSKIKYSHKLIEAIQAEEVSHDSLHFLVSLNKSMIPKPYVQKPRGRFGYRLIVDLMPEAKTERVHHVAPKKIQHQKTIQKKQPEHRVIKKETKPIYSPVNQGRSTIVVIDPGHGGKDPGASGSGGIHEKNVVLAIAKDLNADLKKVPHVVPEMTRNGDYFVTLRGRLDLARKGRADLFMAIHADAYIDSYAHGASVFALSERGASSEAARWLAQKENHSELGGVDLADKSYELRSVLIDLSQTATIRESLEYGWSVIHALREGHLRLHRGAVEQARFVVLKSPDIPSLLIETGFISNRQEELNLNNPHYQKKLAQALADGVVSYLKHYPPPGTWFAMKRDGIKHVIKKGETLYQLSKHYGISVSKIKALNRMKNSKVSVGEVIRVS